MNTETEEIQPETTLINQLKEFIDCEGFTNYKEGKYLIKLLKPEQKSVRIVILNPAKKYDDLVESQRFYIRNGLDVFAIHQLLTRLKDVDFKIAKFEDAVEYTAAFMLVIEASEMLAKDLRNLIPSLPNNKPEEVPNATVDTVKESATFKLIADHQKQGFYIFFNLRHLEAILPEEEFKIYSEVHDLAKTFANEYQEDGNLVGMEGINFGYFFSEFYRKFFK